MAAPSPTAIGTPAGIRMDDGFPTRMVFAASTTASLWEKSIKPPGMDGGEAIETTTMRNTTWRTMASRSLKTLTDMTGEAAYDPVIYSTLLSIINVETTVTIQFYDGTTLAFYGFLRLVEPNDIVEGEQPTLQFTVTPTNVDPTTRGEEAPVLTNVVGT